MRGSSQQGRLQPAYDRFSDACDQTGTKIGTKKIEMFFSRRPRRCILQESGNTLQQVETFKYQVVFTSDGSRNKEIDTRIGKANAVLCELYCSLVTKWELSKTAKLSVLNGSLVRSSPVNMNHRWRLKEYCQKNKQQRRDICDEFSVWHFVRKSTGLKSVKPGMTSHFSESRDPTCVRVVRPCVQNVSGKNGEVSPSGCSQHPRESRPEFVHWPGGVTTSPTLLGPVLVWSEQNYLRLLLIVRYFGSS